MSEIRKGIDQGYSEAFSILEGLGAFNFEGVLEGVETTKQLIEEKLIAYEAQKREELGLDPISVKEKVSSSVENEVLSQAGLNTLHIIA